MIDLKIKRSSDTIVKIERNKYYIKSDGNRYFYLTQNIKGITTDTSCHHITNLPPDSCSIKNEYFYSHFVDLYAEYLVRFDDGDIIEYRKFSDWCPDYLYTEKYNNLKQKTLYQLQLEDKNFYSISYIQPGNKIQQETYCSVNGTMCSLTSYKYNKNGELIKKEITHSEPCSIIDFEGKKRSVIRVSVIEGN
jgi:hypothetical protein